MTQAKLNQSHTQEEVRSLVMNKLAKSFSRCLKQNEFGKAGQIHSYFVNHYGKASELINLAEQYCNTSLIERFYD